MPRFLLFAGITYYPAGGARDLIGAFESIEEAQEADLSEHDWANIHDAQTGVTEWSWSSDDYRDPYGSGWITPPWWMRCFVCGEPEASPHQPDCPHKPSEPLDGDQHG